MKKMKFKSITVFLLTLFVMSIAIPCYALNIGTYQTESEYGLFDGFKINWKKKDPNQKFIEPRQESTKLEAQKELEDYKESEYERTKYMYEGTAIF